MRTWPRLLIYAHGLLSNHVLACTQSHTQGMRVKSCTNAVLSGTWWWVCCRCRAKPAKDKHMNFPQPHTFMTHPRISLCLFFSFFFTLEHCVHTNRKWCQSLSPGRQRRLLRYRDSGFLFLSFSSTPLSHGLTQIDTSPSVAGVHPSLNHRPALGAQLSFTLSSSHSLSLSVSIYLPLSHYRAISACQSS